MIGIIATVAMNVLVAYGIARPYLDAGINNKITANYKKEVNKLNTLLVDQNIRLEQSQADLTQAGVNYDRLKEALGATVPGSAANQMLSRAGEVNSKYVSSKQGDVKKASNWISYLTSEKEKLSDATVAAQTQVDKSILPNSNVKLPTAMTDVSGLVPYVAGTKTRTPITNTTTSGLETTK